eukprot:3451957-Pyramimonas_sp.AAC.1
MNGGNGCDDHSVLKVGETYIRGSSSGNTIFFTRCEVIETNESSRSARRSWKKLEKFWHIIFNKEVLHNWDAFKA